MHPMAAGTVTGILMGLTSSWLITGVLFHRFQIRTPATWGHESWRMHSAAVLLQGLAGGALGKLYDCAGVPPPGGALLALAAAIWTCLAACLLIQALYIRFHPAVALGLLLEWGVFVAGVLFACARLAKAVP